MKKSKDYNRVSMAILGFVFFSVVTVGAAYKATFYGIALEPFTLIFGGIAVALALFIASKVWNHAPAVTQ